jgi:hypothetical protein
MNDNNSRTPEQKADPAHWRVGDIIMMRPDALAADRTAHPHAGRLGRIVDIRPARPTNVLFVSLEVAVGAGTDTYVALPDGMFLGLPEFCVETYRPRPGYTAWRLSAEGHRVLTGMGWPITPASLGSKE